MSTQKKVKKERYEFSFILFSSNAPTINGHIYTPELLHNLCERFTKKPKIIIQEMNEVERKVKKIPVELPWTKQIMADVIKGEMVEGELVVYALCRANREGRKLEGILKNIGMENLTFFPIGYGETDDNKVIKPNYQLNYIAVEPKKK
jgi:hypothetical protein